MATNVQKQAVPYYRLRRFKIGLVAENVHVNLCQPDILVYRPCSSFSIKMISQKLPIIPAAHCDARWIDNSSKWKFEFKSLFNSPHKVHIVDYFTEREGFPQAIQNSG
jgi:hypothetical protein